jgi:hypothetical protein
MKNKKMLPVLGILIILLFVGCLHRPRLETTTTEFTSTTSTTKTSTTRATTSVASSTTSTTVPAGGMSNLSQVKSAILYERVSDGVAFGRSMDEVVDIVEETRADLVLRCFFRWQPVRESSDAAMPGYPANYVSEKAKIGYTYEQYGDAIKQIKAAKPNTILVGAIAEQRLNQIEFNDVTGESFTQAQTWDMAFDPAKFNLTSVLGSKESVQCRIAKGIAWTTAGTNCALGYNAKTAAAYFPDLTNEQYRKLLLSHAEKQIDLGADGIWIDMLFTQANVISKVTGNPNHPAVEASYDAAAKLVDEIHAYGLSKGRYVYVGTWWQFTELPYSPPDVDFVTATPKSEEITGGLDEERWDNTTSEIKAKLGDIPVFAFIDWTDAGAPIDVFSQKLTPAQQREFLVEADSFFTQRGIVFAYPVHGGTFPQTSKQLSFGKFGVYDSLAPEFQTYETIKELAQNKSK